MTRTFREGYIGMPPEDASGTQLKGLQSTQDAYGVKIDDTFNPIVKFYGATVPLDSLKIWYDPNLTETINGSTVKNAIDINNASQTATWSSTPSTGTTNGKTYWNINSTQQLLVLLVIVMALQQEQAMLLHCFVLFIETLILLVNGYCLIEIILIMVVLYRIEEYFAIYGIMVIYILIQMQIQVFITELTLEATLSLLGTL